MRKLWLAASLLVAVPVGLGWAAGGFNLNAINGTPIAAPTAYGTAPSGSVTGVNAFITNTNSFLTIDEAAFTQGTSAMSVLGCFYSTSITNLLTDTSGAVRCTTDRTLFTNLANVNGAAVLTGAGAVGSGAQRIVVGQDTTTIAGAAPGTAGTASANVVTVQGVAAMTPLAQNHTQVNGSAVSTAATGVQKVGVVGNAGAAFDGATGAAAPANAVQLGAVSAGNLTGIVQADSSAAINVSTATTTQIVALASAKKIYVTSFNIIAGGTGNITFEYGTGASCGTGTTVLTGAYNLTAQAGIAIGGGLGPVLVVPAGDALCVLTTAAVQMSGSVSYTQY